MIAGNLTHQSHDEHVVVDGQITFLEDRSQFELVGSNLIVAGLDGDTEFQRFYFQLFHEGSHTRWNSTEVVVFELLVFGAVVSGQCTSGHQEVGAGGIQPFVNQEVFLFPAQIGDYLFYIRIEVVAYVHCCFVHRTQCFEQRCFVVQ